MWFGADLPLALSAVAVGAIVGFHKFGLTGAVIGAFLGIVVLFTYFMLLLHRRPAVDELTLTK